MFSTLVLLGKVLLYLKRKYMIDIHTHTHTTIHHYNPSVRIIDIVSHTTYVVYINFMREWRYLQFKVESERQIFSETSRWMNGQTDIIYFLLLGDGSDSVNFFATFVNIVVFFFHKSIRRILNFLFPSNSIP